ncbi:hypothetical protein IJI70_03055 [Candidatus Saccharibacteria bacterium]|nr:hypothetical protein [Candidatus Saccharibacteria bacterium]
MKENAENDFDLVDEAKEDFKKSEESKILSVEPVKEEPILTEPLSTEPKKKSKKGLLVFLSLVLIFGLVGGGVFYFFFFIYNSPENIALGAVKNLLMAENLVVDGKISIIDTAIEENGDKPKFPFERIKAVSVKFDSDAGGRLGFGASNIDLTVEMRNEDVDPLEFTIGSILPSNGKLYLYIDGLHDAFAELVEKELEGEGLDFEELEEPEDYEDVLSTEEFTFISELSETLEKLDETWVEVTAEDAVEIAGEYFRLNSAEKAKITKYLECIGNVGRNFKTRLTEISDLYEKFKFVEVGKNSYHPDGSSQDKLALTSDFYYLRFSPKTLAQFVTEVRNSRVGKEIWSCTEKFERENEIEALAGVEVGDLSEGEIVEVVENYNSDFYTYTEISKDRVLKKFVASNVAVALDSKGEKPFIDVNLDFSYPESIEVKTPSEYTSLSDLFKEFIKNTEQGD